MKCAGMVLTALLAALVVGAIIQTGPVRAQNASIQDSHLVVVWTSGDPEVAHRVCFMYTHNAKKQKWFDEVILIVWGPSARLLAADKDLQAKIKAMMDDGVRPQACLACSDSYGVTEQLRKLGIEAKYMGRPLTDMLKQNWKILTF